MPFRDPQRHLEDVLDAIEKIEAFIGDIDLTAYRTEEKRSLRSSEKFRKMSRPANIRRSARRDTVA